MWICVLLLMIAECIADETTQEPNPGMDIAARLAKTLPQIPNVIHSQMEGKPEELRQMISQMLGDGLISQLVVNPFGVAEGMGVPLSTLGINKTDVEGRFGGAPLNRTFGGGLFPFVTTPSTTTEKVMYLDGVPIKDFDEFVRNRNLEERFSTKKPATTTTPVPSASDIAAAVVDQLKVSMPVAQPPPALVQKPLAHSAAPDNFDVSIIDPSRIQEVNTLLRRAPQKFDTPDAILAGAPSLAQTPLDPEVNAVVTSLRTGSVMNVEQIRQLQNILQTYEQSLQTKELIAKRKQLQLLQNELIEQRKKIEEQRKLEEELRKKEQELEVQRQAMELQLQQQLRMWHNSFSSSRDPKMPLVPLELSETALPPAPPLIAPSPLSMGVGTEAPKETVHLPKERRLSPPHLSRSSESDDVDVSAVKMAKPLLERADSTQEKEEDLVPPVAVNQFWPKVVANSNRNRKVPTTTESQSQSEEDSDEFTSSCKCEKISLQKMKGKWSMALASKALIEKLRARMRTLLPKESKPQLSCSRMTMLTPKISDVAQDARISWEFRTTGSRKLYRLTGSALSMDHRSVRLQLRDLSNEIFSVPMCVLKYSGTFEYQYMVVANGNGPCREAALLVRNVDKFFDEDNPELVSFLKQKIANNEMDTMDIAPFASECSQN